MWPARTYPAPLTILSGGGGPVPGEAVGLPLLAGHHLGAKGDGRSHHLLVGRGLLGAAGGAGRRRGSGVAAVSADGDAQAGQERRVLVGLQGALGLVGLQLGVARGVGSRESCVDGEQPLGVPKSLLTSRRARPATQEASRRHAVDSSAKRAAFMVPGSACNCLGALSSTCKASGRGGRELWCRLGAWRGRIRGHLAAGVQGERSCPPSFLAAGRLYGPGNAYAAQPPGISTSRMNAAGAESN